MLKTIQKLFLTVSFSFAILLVSISVQAQETPDILQLADSLVKQTLEKEGLFTVLGGLKPISTVSHFQFPIDSISKEFIDPVQVRQHIQTLTASLEMLSDEYIGFVVVPFKAVFGNMRSFQVLVYNTASIQKTIETYGDFFIKRGMITSSDPKALLMMVEFEEKMDRFRAYGYLFGYPSYAVDFFVEAALHEENTGDFVRRSFFQIPVASSETGRFVYALPENQEPSPVDLELKKKAGEILETYKTIQNEQMIQKNTFPNLHLFKFLRENF